MPQLSLDDSYQYIDCIDAETGMRKYSLTYCISCQPDTETVEIDSSRILSLPSFEPLSESDCEYSIKYWRNPQTLESPVEKHIESDLITAGSLTLGHVLPIGRVEELFETRQGFEFYFHILVREEVALADFHERNLIDLNWSEDSGCRQVLIANRIEAPNQAVDLRNYLQAVGDLGKEIVWDIEVVAHPPSFGWRVHIDEIRRPFSRDEYSKVLDNALDTQRLSPLERVPNYLRRNYRESADHELPVRVQIPEIRAGENCTIYVTLRDPTRQVLYSTGIADLDRVLQNVHEELIEQGIPLGPRNYRYQLVLSRLLRYRNGFLTVANFVDEDLVERGEIRGFHAHLQRTLHTSLDFGPPTIISESEIGNSRVDLLIEDIPTELKLERRVTATTDDIVESYAGQAADYAARCEASLGFLVVLDAVEDRGRPTSPARHDVRVTSVQTVSGESVIVVTVVLRVPPSASTR